MNILIYILFGIGLTFNGLGSLALLRFPMCTRVFTAPPSAQLSDRFSPLRQ